MSLGQFIGTVIGATIGFFIGGPMGAVVGASIGMGVGGYIDPLTPDIPAVGAPVQDLQITTNEIGLPIPDCLGTVKLGGNLLWFGGERSEAITQEVGGGGKGGGDTQTQTTGYRYYMSWAMGICAGPVDEILTIFKNEDIVWSGNTVRPVSGGQETIVIEGMGSMTLFFGTDDQTADFYIQESVAGLPLGWFYDNVLAANVLRVSANLDEGSEAVNYNLNSRGLCWAFFDDCYIGDYNRMPTMRFVIRKTPEKTFSEYGTVQTLDYNPAHAMHYILHDLTGLPETWLDEDDFEAMAETLYIEGRGISLLMDSQQSALNYLESINSHIDAIVRYGSDGKFHPKLIRDDYTPANLPTIDESVVLDDPTISRKSWIDTVNEIKVQYSGITVKRNHWVINGGAWTGAVVTVGEGQDFTNLRAAIVATQEDSLFLLYPGSYDLVADTTEWNAYRRYFRGMGSSYADVILTISAYSAIYSATAPAVIFEWMTIYHTMLNSVNEAGTIIFNRCDLLGHVDSAYFAVNASFALPIKTPPITFQNCFARTYSTGGIYGWLWCNGRYNIGATSLIKCEIPDPTTYNTSGGFLVNDVVTTPTNLYGPDYGTDLIVSELEYGSVDIKQSTADPVAVDIGNKEIQDRVVSKTVQMALFTLNENAVWGGVNALRKDSYPFAVVSFPANRDAFQLEVGDCFKLTYARYGIIEMICRVLSIAEDGPESETITVTAQEDVFSVSTAVTAFTTPSSHAVDPPDYTVTPFTHQTIIEAPYSIAGEAIKLIPLACRESSLDLGYDVYLSIDGGTSYTFLQKVNVLRPYGILADAYGLTNTIDDSTGFTVDFEQGADLIETTTFDQVLAGLKNTALLGDEIINFQTITPDEGTEYLIETIIRGRYDTIKETHAEDEEVWCIPSGLPTLLTHSSFLTGAELKFKFVPYNVKQAGAIADCDPISITIEGRALTPYIPTNLEANGIGADALYESANYDDDIELTWTARKRGEGAGIGLPGIVLAEDDIEGYFKVEVYVSDSLVRTTDEIEDTTWTYTEAMNEEDNTSLAAEVVLKVSNYRSSGGNTYESDQAEITVTLNE